MSAERWRQWEAPLRVEPARLDQGLWLPDGRVLSEPEITWSAEQIERFRLGYKCMNCLEPQERPFPEKCSLCGYPMRTRQAEFFAAEFAGEIEIGGRDWDAELEGLEERRRKQEERLRKTGGDHGADTDR